MAQKKGSDSVSKAKVGLGVGLTAAAVAAAGAYFLYGSKKADQNRKKVKGWMLKAKGEVLEALEKANKMSEEEYRALVEGAVGAYGSAKKATSGELKEFKSEMEQHWNKLQKSGLVKKFVEPVASPKKAAKPKAKAAPKKKSA